MNTKKETNVVNTKNDTVVANQKKRHPIQKIGRSLGVGLLILIFALIFSTLYEKMVSKLTDDQYPSPGKLVEVNGHKIHIQIRGKGSPTIVFESGYGAPSTYWNKIAQELSKEATVVTYDRAGYGWSEGTKLPRTGDHIVDDLHKALLKNGLDGPYILVSHSIGTQYSRLFADKFLEKVKGIVLLDPRSENFGKRAELIYKEAGLDPEKAEAQPIELYRFFKGSGVLRILKGPILGDAYPSNPERDTAVNVFYTSKFFDSMEAEPKAYKQLENQIRGRTLGNTPLTIISQSGRKWTPLPKLSDGQNRKMSVLWRDEQEKMTLLSSDHRLVIAQKSGHDIAIDEPGLVIDEIRNQLKKVQSAQ